MKKNSDISLYSLTSENVCQKLGVSIQTLYSYVSRGYIRAKEDPADPRKSLYNRLDIAELYKRKQRGRSNHDIATSTIDWGEPILQSKISSIVDGQLFYQDSDAITLSATASLEDIAFKLLDIPVDSIIKQRIVNPTIDIDLPPFIRMLKTVSEEATLTDEIKLDRAYLLKRTALAVAGYPNINQQQSIHTLLADSWCDGDKKAEDLIRRALVLCADHELNPSTFTARISASMEASISSCILAGLSTFSGKRHAGSTDYCLKWMKKNLNFSAKDIKGILKKEQTLPLGFGHPLYPDGDPRAKSLLQLCPPPQSWNTIIKQVNLQFGTFPNIDFALAVLEHQLKLPKGASLALFAMGRMVGWFAHINEQQILGKPIRPRARD